MEHVEKIEQVITSEQVAKALILSSLFIINKFTKLNKEQLPTLLKEGYDAALEAITVEGALDIYSKDFDEIMTGTLDIDKTGRIR